MSLNILKYPASTLTVPSEPITEITQEHRDLVEEMTALMYKAEGIGIAAPQVGKNIRLVVVDVSGPEVRDARMVLVNPKLTPVPGCGKIDSEEGCLSVTDYRSKVKRYARVLLEAHDLDGNPIQFEADETLSICLQHEVDHLNGILFIDRISYLKRTMYDTKVKKWLRAGA